MRLKTKGLLGATVLMTLLVAVLLAVGGASIGFIAAYAAIAAPFWFAVFAAIKKIWLVLSGGGVPDRDGADAAAE